MIDSHVGWPLVICHWSLLLGDWSMVIEILVIEPESIRIESNHCHYPSPVTSTTTVAIVAILVKILGFVVSVSDWHGAGPCNEASA